MGGVREGTKKGRIAGNTSVDRTPETGYMSVKQETGNRLQVTGSGNRERGNRKQDRKRKKEKETGAGNRKVEKETENRRR
jgi:hypothetical protein